MPRKKAPEAGREEEAARNARLRYLLRNPNFRSEFNDLRREIREIPISEDGTAHPERVDRIGRMEDFRCKWSLDDLSCSIVLRHEYPDLATETVKYFENLLAANTANGLWYPPVALRFEYPGVVGIYVELNQPLDLLLALIEKQLRRAVAIHRSRRRQTLRQSRRRLDRVGLYLDVFDRAEQAETFAAIARALNRRVSTVKSAYLAASRNIFGPRAGLSKKALPLARFDPVGHCQKCPICQKAETPEQLCPKALVYANQDQRGQWALTGLETTRDVSKPSITMETQTRPDESSFDPAR